MMEAIQIGPAVFGPLPPGSGGGHGNTVARGISGLQDIFSKTRSIDLTAQEGAQNTLTDLQEFKWGDIFMTFNYQKKGEKFFANGRPIEDINDPNEVGGDRMGRVITALNQMAADKNIEEAIVVSEDLGYGRHFIYRYRREENGDIEGLAFEYQGREEELGSLVRELGSRAIDRDNIKNKSINFSVPLFFTKENKNSVSDLARAAHNSFSSGERRRDMKKYLDRLNRDTEGFDELMHRRKMQEEELAKQFEKIILSNPDAKAGIAAAVYGAINIAQTMGLGEDRRREEAKQEVYQTPNIYRQDIRDAIRSFSYGLVAIPEFIDHTGRLLDKDKKSVQVKEHTVTQIIEPVVPGIIGLSAAIISFPIENLGGENNPASGDGEDQRTISSEGDHSTETLFWQEVISAMFESVEQEIKVGEEMNEFLQLETVFVEALVDFVSHAEEDSMPLNGLERPLLVENQKKQEMLITSFQAGLEVIVGLIERDEGENLIVQSEEELQQMILENDIVTLGRELFGLLISDENKPPIDTVGRIAFLLRVYEDPNSTELVKSFIAALIYKQIQQFKENRHDFRENPEIAEIFEKFDKLSPFTSFFESRFSLLFSVLQKFYPVIFIGDSKENIDAELTSKLIFVICHIAKKEEMYSFEKLQPIGLLNMKNIFFSQRKSMERKKYGIIYQYSPYLSQTVYM